MEAKQREKSFLELLCEADPSIAMKMKLGALQSLEGLNNGDQAVILPPSLENEPMFDSSGGGKRQKGDVKVGEAFIEKKPKKISWSHINLTREKLDVRITELHNLVRGSTNSKLSMAAVLLETKECITSLLHQMSSLYEEHTQNYPRQQELDMESGWRNGLRDRGLCLVPIEAISCMHQKN